MNAKNLAVVVEEEGVMNAPRAIWIWHDAIQISGGWAPAASYISSDDAEKYIPENTKLQIYENIITGLRKDLYEAMAEISVLRNPGREPAE